MVIISVDLIMSYSFYILSLYVLVFIISIPFQNHELIHKSCLLFSFLLQQLLPF